MELEDRYIVLKKTDVNELSQEAQRQLGRLCNAVNFIREQRGKQPLKSVVVESDWPEYAETKRLILDEGPTVAEVLWEIALGGLLAYAVYGASLAILAK